MYTLGINFSHHSSIALLKDNEVVLFVLEERFNRKKLCKGIPLKALGLIKNITNKIDYIVCAGGGRSLFPTVINELKKYGVAVTHTLTQKGFHHLYHAAAGFYMSHLDEASCLIIDGSGFKEPFKVDEKTQVVQLNACETTSVYEAAYPNKFKCTHKYYTVGIYDNIKFNFTDDFHVKVDITDEDVRLFQQRIGKRNNIDNVYASNKLDIGWMYTFVTGSIGFPKMGGEGKTMGLSAYGPLSNDKKAKAAYNIQKQLEAAFTQKASLCSSNNIILSGGCALNILGNSLIKKTFPDKNIYIDPVGADGTVALGAAAYHFYSTTHCTDKLIFNAYGGPQYNLDKEYINELARKYSI